MKNSYKLLIDTDLINKYQNSQDQDALSVLLERHSLLLKKLANQHCRKFPFNALEDALQNANLGAIIAISRFNLNQKNKFTTFLYTTVYYHLLSCNDEESFIKCPPQLREVKSYAAGKYTDAKKYDFEKKHNLNSKSDIEDFKKKYSVFDNVEVQDILPEQSENNFEEINLRIMLSELSTEEKEIAQLIIEGYTVSEISKILPGSYKQIRNKISKMSRII